ncbi:MAG: hypothetical protein N4A33_10965 [Bacteriovoracaceae bacterium]|jgi:hypothetical protein|nr:hypothetical protein [Bacteriovoracaceae bacterium]
MNKVSKAVLGLIAPLKIVWLGSIVSVAMNVFIVLIAGGNTALSFETIGQEVLWFIFLIGLIVFTFQLHKRKYRFVGAVDSKKTPFLTPYTEDEKDILKFYPKYFIFMGLIWFLSCVATMGSLALSYTSGNLFYVLVIGIINCVLIIFQYKPNYLNFVVIKKRILNE